jgi:triosephosphate isomerase
MHYMSSMKKYIVGNWKMNGAAPMARPLLDQIAAAAAGSPDTLVVVCPPALLISQVVSWLAGSQVKTGGQDCSDQPQGAYTGDISATMLHEAGCQYVIVGHSERRQYHHESNATVHDKAAQAIKVGLIPIICIGETARERDAGQAEAVVGRQITESAPRSGQFLFAYEPVWAIGSGKTPTGDDIWRMHAHIISMASKETGLAPAAISVLYGGSVNAANSGAILATEHVAGVLVGGASLKAEEFSKIIASAGA